MSATIHAELFQSYLRRREDDEVPLLYIEGRVHPITLKYLPNDDADYVEKTLVSIFQLHRELPPEEHFLVFLTGEEEIEMVCGKVRQIGTVYCSYIAPKLLLLQRRASIRVSQRSTCAHCTRR